MPRFLIASLLCLLTATVLVACDDGDNGNGGVTPAVPSPGVPTPSATVAASPRPTGTPANLPPVDGTVDPLGFGGTDPVSVKSNPDPLPAAPSLPLLQAVRIGAHPEQGGWDRIVFEFRDNLPAAEIQYVTSVVGCGSGAPIAVGGTAILEVRMQPVNAHTDAGQPTVATQIRGPGGAIVEAKQSCDFEAHVNWAIGVDAKERFKVTRLSNPTRLVIDIKQ